HVGHSLTHQGIDDPRQLVRRRRDRLGCPHLAGGCAPWVTDPIGALGIEARLALAGPYHYCASCRTGRAWWDATGSVALLASCNAALIRRESCENVHIRKVKRISRMSNTG